MTPTYTCTVSTHFSAGHRIVGLDGAASKCANLHGHTFGVEVELAQDSELAVEFTAVKEQLFGWVKAFLDHGYFVHCDDEVLLTILRDNGWKRWVTLNRPTTEEIAAVIFYAAESMFPNVRVRRVHVTEGPHNAATAWGDT